MNIYEHLEYFTSTYQYGEKLSENPNKHLFLSTYVALNVDRD